jgi:hypothetical protein
MTRFCTLISLTYVLFREHLIPKPIWQWMLRLAERRFRAPLFMRECAFSSSPCQSSSVDPRLSFAVRVGSAPFLPRRVRSCTVACEDYEQQINQRISWNVYQLCLHCMSPVARIEDQIDNPSQHSGAESVTSEWTQSLADKRAAQVRDSHCMPPFRHCRDAGSAHSGIHAWLRARHRTSASTHMFVQKKSFQSMLLVC